MYHQIKYLIATSVIYCFFSSCSKSIEVDPPVNQIISSEVFKSDSTAKSAVLGIYSEMMRNQGQFCNGQTTLYAGLSANELYFFTPDAKQEFANNEIGINNHSILAGNFWNTAYKYIYTTNLILEQLKKSNITPSLKASLTGEVLFIRSFCYFYLINLFGDVPLVLTTDYEKNAILSRSEIGQIYEQLVNDLTQAAAVLPTSNPSADRARVNKWAAKALLARIYLYQKNWTKASENASDVINSGMYSLASISNVFLKNSTETILQLQSVNTVWNTWEAREIIPSSVNETPKYLLTSRMYQSFEASDSRKTTWVGVRTFAGQSVQFPAKYKVYGNGAPITEYYILLRLAEQYLIRAEARANNNDISNGLSDLNIIRQRAGLGPAFAGNTAELLSLIDQERQSELFAEWGHRWFDLKRTGRINAVMQSINPTTWQPMDALYPIPNGEILLNSYLTQNPGY